MTGRRTPIGTLIGVLVALAILVTACSSGDGETIVEPAGSDTTAAPSTTQAGDIEVPTTPATDDNGDTGEPTPTSDATDDTSESTEPDASTTTSEPETSQPATTETTATFTSSPETAEGDKKGCPEGQILVGSNGTEPICQQPSGGCPDGYRIIGGTDGAALCQDDQGNVLKVFPDGTITPDTSVPFNGPVCRRLDENGNLLELGLATSQEDCESRGGEYLPDGL